jgi:rhodanese-related sulfurtransferase
MVKDVSCEELKELVQAGAILVDVREDKNQSGQKQIQGGEHKHVPLSTLHSEINSLSSNKKKVFYCRSGLLSYQAAEIVSSKTSSETYYLKGGLIKYYEQ